MPTLSATVPLTPAYSRSVHQLVLINPATIGISIDVQEGTHTFTSPFQQVGSLRYSASPLLEAAIRITYSYDAAARTLDLYGSDFVSPGQSTCLLTRPMGTNQLCVHHAYGDDANHSGGNPDWNHSLAYTPGLPAALTESIRAANERIIAAARTVFPVVRVRTPPPAFESAEEAHKWMIMQARDGTSLGTFDPAKEYPEGATMENVARSTWNGVVYFQHNENIANVLYSTGDPQIAGLPWIELWERQFGTENECTSHNWASGKVFSCNDSVRQNIIGGHVITGTKARSVPAGSDNVYIIPICKAHNNNNNVYMRTDVYTMGISLSNYMGK